MEPSICVRGPYHRPYHGGTREYWTVGIWNPNNDKSLDLVPSNEIGALSKETALNIARRTTEATGFKVRLQIRKVTEVEMWEEQELTEEEGNDARN